jgi:hypothetical protein
MAKAVEWGVLIAVLGVAGIAVLQMQGAGGNALLGILGLLLFAAAASALRLVRVRGGRIGSILPIGVDWQSGLPKFTPHDGADAGHDSRKQD